MTTEIDDLTELAYEGSGLPLTTTSVVGTPSREYAGVLAPGADEVAADEIRVTILGSGDPFAWPDTHGAPGRRHTVSSGRSRHVHLRRVTVPA